MSVTVWQVMALRAAKNAGMDVPKEAIDDAVGYIKRLYSPGDEKQPGAFGGFGYTVAGARDFDDRRGAARAAGLRGIQLARSLRRVGETVARWGRAERALVLLHHLLLRAGHVSARRQARGAKGGASSLSCSSRSNRAKAGGKATAARSARAAEVYATTMAMLSLAVKNHFLPIYQR